MTTIFATTLVACEKCRPDLVGAGVARLTVRNVGAIAELVNSDTNCGFESPEVKADFTTRGNIGAAGTATWTIEECEIDLGDAPQIISTDCDGNSTAMSGRIVVSAKRTIAGTLTGNADQPAIPMSPDAVTVEITRAELFNFYVESSNSDSKLTQVSGALSAKVKPKLGASASTGVCMIPTSNAAITDVVYDNASVRVQSDGRDFMVDVITSDFWAVNGRVGKEENSLSGSINVWGDIVAVPGDDDGLDPEYDREKFDDSFACTDDLKSPVSYECGDVAPVLAQGAARLTIRSIGAIAHLTEHDASCGFASPAVLAAATLSAPVGSNGDANFAIENCTINLPEGTVLSTDCQGVQTLVSGSYTVTARKKLTGRLSGDREQPVVPNNDTPAQVTIERVTFNNFRVASDGTALTMVEGSIGATLIPRVAMDDALGACAAETPNARFSDVRYGAGTKLKLEAPQGTFETTVDESNLSAVNGTMGSDTNLLDGTISIGGKPFMLPTDPADDGLDPEFNASTFNSSWICGTINPQAPFECSISQTLGRGAAQLSVLTLGTIADLIEADTTCGFSSPNVLAGVQTTGTLGEVGATATFTISEACRVSFNMPTATQTDCNGKITYVQGMASVRGTKTLAGFMSGDPLQPIVPNTRDPATLSLSVVFTDFKVSTSEDSNALLVRTGELSGTVRPRVAIDAITGACSLPTPIAELSNISWKSASLNIASDGKTFDTQVGASMLTAVNGTRDGISNRLSGSITIDGDQVAIDTALDPAFSQAAFDASYACTPNMLPANSDEDCNMEKVLAEGAARLLVAATGAVTGIVNEDSDCGFQSNLTDPSSVVGEPGTMGSMEWEIQNCALERTGRDATRASETDCLNRASYWSGVATVTGKRTVLGLREEISLIIISFDSIVPKSREAVTVTESMINFNEFKSYDLDPGETAPSRSITIHSGQAAATVQPILGERSDEPGTFDVPTKVARLSNISYTNAQLTIVSDGKTFKVPVSSASLNAFNGSYGTTGEKNMISGSITAFGKTFTLEPQDLDPDFNQADFDARYVCTEDLRSTVPPAN